MPVGVPSSLTFISKVPHNFGNNSWLPQCVAIYFSKSCRQGPTLDSLLESNWLGSGKDMLYVHSVVAGALRLKTFQVVRIGHFRSAIKLVSLDRL